MRVQLNKLSYIKIEGKYLTCSYYFSTNPPESFYLPEKSSSQTIQKRKEVAASLLTTIYCRAIDYLHRKKSE